MARGIYGHITVRPPLGQADCGSWLLTLRLAIGSKTDKLHRDIQSIYLRLGIDLSNNRAMDFSGGARSSGGELSEQQIMQEVSKCLVPWCSLVLLVQG